MSKAKDILNEADFDGDDMKMLRRKMTDVSRSSSLIETEERETFSELVSALEDTTSDITLILGVEDGEKFTQKDCEDLVIIGKRLIDKANEYMTVLEVMEKGL